MKQRAFRKIAWLALALGVGVPSASIAQGAGTPVNPATPFPALRVAATVEEHLKETQALGVAVAVVKNGAIVYQRGFGLRDRDRRLPVDSATRFEIGSVTKQFTAAAILQLKERHKLALDDPLAKYVPEFPHAGELTLRQLLNQTSGLFEFMQTNHFMQIAKGPGSFDRIEDLVRGPLHFTPGTQWEYSNTNYVALGRVVEVTSGESFETYVRRHLFRTAGMSHSSTIDYEFALKNMAHGYWRGMRNNEPLSPGPPLSASWARSAGFIVSTVGDLAKWDLALQAGKIITPADFALMTTPPTFPNGKFGDYGMGWWVDSLKGHKRFDHDGDTFGFSSSNWIFPDEKLAIVLLENEPNDAAARITRKIFDSLVP